MSLLPQIVVGTYEEFVLGYKPKNEGEKFEFFQTFATHSHQASVRCVAAHNHLMASSGADEYINIYDMVEMEVSTVINYHDSTVTCLEFTPDGSHLVTANQNGDIAIFRCKDWVLVKLWKQAHKHPNGVTSTSIHPSGCLLLTTGADNIVRFWNLIKGRQAYATNFSKKCTVGSSLNFGLWSKRGSFYAVFIGSKVEVYKTETAAVVYEIQTKIRCTCAAFVKENLICVGTEDGSLEIHCISEKQLLFTEKAHNTRIKNITTFDITVNKSDKIKLQHFITSVDSKGVIKLWLLKKNKAVCNLTPKGEVNCDCRITCLTVVFPKDIKKEEDSSEEANLTKTSDILENENTSCNGSREEISTHSFASKTKNKNQKQKEIVKKNTDSQNHIIAKMKVKNIHKSNGSTDSKKTKAILEKKEKKLEKLKQKSKIGLEERKKKLKNKRLSENKTKTKSGKIVKNT